MGDDGNHHFYWLLNLGYCAKFKQYAIIDVCIVAFGFVLRLLAGGVATGIVLSKWIVLMTFLITLFMSLPSAAMMCCAWRRRARLPARIPSATTSPS